MFVSKYYGDTFRALLQAVHAHIGSEVKRRYFCIYY